jgi:hypothetical protein
MVAGVIMEGGWPTSGGKEIGSRTKQLENLGLECIGRVGGRPFEWPKGGDSERTTVLVYFHCPLTSDAMSLTRCLPSG